MWAQGRRAIMTAYNDLEQVMARASPCIITIGNAIATICSKLVIISSYN